MESFWIDTVKWQVKVVPANLKRVHVKVLAKARSPVLLDLLRSAFSDIDAVTDSTDGVWSEVPAEYGMRVALACGCLHCQPKERVKRIFLNSLRNLPSEAVLYWFTLCFYSACKRQGRNALRALLAE